MAADGGSLAIFQGAQIFQWDIVDAMVAKSRQVPVTLKKRREDQAFLPELPRSFP